MKEGNISFVQLNMKKAFAAAIELNATLTKLGDYVCLLSEPHTFKGRPSSLPPNCICISNEGETLSLIHI